MIQPNCLDLTLAMKDSNKCRKININHRTRINIYMSRASSHEEANDSDREGQQQISEQINNSTRINLRSASEYEREIRRFQLRNLSSRAHEYLIQKAKKWSRKAQLCASRLSQVS